MPVTDLMLDGVNLMLLGMGTVFVFLAILVAAMSIMSKLASRLSTETHTTLPVSTSPRPSGAVDDGEMIAVISAAISRYRSRHR